MTCASDSYDAKVSELADRIFDSTGWHGEVLHTVVVAALEEAIEYGRHLNAAPQSPATARPGGIAQTISRSSADAAASSRGALHSWLGTLAYSSAEGLGATLTPAECKELHGLLMLLDGPEQNAAPQTAVSASAVAQGEGAASPMMTGEPLSPTTAIARSADAAPHHLNQEPQDFAAALALLKLAREEIARLRGPSWCPISTAPKDQNLILTDGQNVSEGGWLSDEDMGADYEGQFGGGAGWWSVHGSMIPAHWQPMPAPYATHRPSEEK
jgi:hypothetical protein